MRSNCPHTNQVTRPNVIQTGFVRIATPFLILLFLVMSACNLHFDVDSVEQPTEIPDASNNTPETGPELKDCTAQGAKECGGICRDTLSDPWNCGACGNVCAGFESCLDGECLDTSCPEFEGHPTLCDPVFQTGSCDFVDETCTLHLAFDSGVPSHFEVGCHARPMAETPPGSPCSKPHECAEGTYCTGWEKPDPRGSVCSKFCDVSTGEGCNVDEFCTNPYDDLLDGLGFCTPRCDPLDAKACPKGSACTPDFDHDANSCHANFRCLQNGGTAEKSAGSPCNAAALHIDGCPTDLICIENQCAKPCATSDDCGNQHTCRQAPEPWSASRFCQKEQPF